MYLPLLYLQQSEFGKTPSPRPHHLIVTRICISGPFQVMVYNEKSSDLLSYAIIFFFLAKPVQLLLIL